MSHLDPGGERVPLSAYERRQIKLIEQNLASEDPRSVGGQPADNDVPYPMWVALTVTVGWLMWMSLVSGSVILVLLAVTIAALTGVSVYRRHRSESEDRSA